MRDETDFLALDFLESSSAETARRLALGALDEKGDRAQSVEIVPCWLVAFFHRPLLQARILDDCTTRLVFRQGA